MPETWDTLPLNDKLVANAEYMADNPPAVIDTDSELWRQTISLQREAAPIIAAARQWAEASRAIPVCAGYPRCDGDLEGEPHEPACPCFHVDMTRRELALRSAEAHLLAILEGE